MKKLLLLCTGVLVAAVAHGQIFVSGNYNLSSSSTKNESSSGNSNESSISTVTLIPRVGYAFGNWVAGADAGFSNTNNRSEITPGTGKQKDRIFLTTIGPFVRYVHRPVEWMGLWGELQAGAQFGNRSVNSNRVYRQSGFSTGIRPGVIFYVGKHLSFEASYGSLRFDTSKTTYEDDSTDRNTSGGLILNSSSFLFGANWLF